MEDTRFLDSVNDAAARSGGASDGVLLMLKVLFFLLLIIGMFLFLMKMLAKKRNVWMRGRAVKTLGGVPLGQNKSVQLVEIGRSIYVLGVGDDVTLVQKIDDPDEVASIAASFESESLAGSGGLPFLDRLRGKTKRDKQLLGDEEEVAASFQQMFQMKMNHMTSRKKAVEDLLKDDPTFPRSGDS